MNTKLTQFAIKNGYENLEELLAAMEFEVKMQQQPA
jgi:hypothetical protein